ncbi:hypothetical protein SAMN04488123_10870, partial [Natribacillus halophilus]
MIPQKTVEPVREGSEGLGDPSKDSGAGP